VAKLAALLAGFQFAHETRDDTGKAGELLLGEALRFAFRPDLKAEGFAVGYRQPKCGRASLFQAVQPL